jgi:hypothetical protein
MSSRVDAAQAHLPSRRRWMRVFFSSLRCFFFAIRLRRFLMTEPTFHLSRTGRTARAGMTAQGYSERGTRRAASCSGEPDTRRSSAGLEVRPPEIFVDRRLGNTEGPPDPSCRKLAGVNQPVDRHIRNSHGGSHLGDRQELDIGDRLISGPVRGHLSHPHSGPWRAPASPLELSRTGYG